MAAESILKCMSPFFDSGRSGLDGRQVPCHLGAVINTQPKNSDINLGLCPYFLHSDTACSPIVS
jgi:hypothetical protein